MSPPDLDVEVRALLESRRGEWLLIAKEAGVSHSWISKFVCGRIPNPGFATLRDLWVYLTRAAQPQAAGAAQVEPANAT